MRKYFLTEIITKDKLVHQGIYFEPPKKSDTAVIYVHGLTGNFYGNMGFLEVIISEIEKQGIGLASFNNRGHDCIAEMHQIDSSSEKGYKYFNGGAGYEKFTDCIYDIEAGISFLESQGYKKIILVGHSTGANKVCYYAGTTIDRRVFGVVLASSMSDRLEEKKNNPKLALNLRQMQKMIPKNKENFLVNNLLFFPVTPKRYLSLFGENSTEDVFDYGEDQPKLTCFSKIIQPMLVILAELDEHADRPITDIQQTFDAHTKSKNYSSIIIKNAFHGYYGKEDEFAKMIVKWIVSLKK